MVKKIDNGTSPGNGQIGSSTRNGPLSIIYC